MKKTPYFYTLIVRFLPGIWTVLGQILDTKQDSPESGSDMRVGRELLKATAPFAVESVPRSWWQVGSTFALLLVSLTGAGIAPGWPLRLMLSLLGALAMVRAFITYHDYMHGAILKDSRLASIIFRTYAALALTPPNSWRKSHNYHHRHVGQVSDVSIGAFPVITTKMWREASWKTRLSYRVERHPLTVLCGYVTIFLLSVTLLPLFKKPLRHLDSLVALLAHATLITVLWVYGGFDVAFFVVLLPMSVASALGSYLFFAQHSFKNMHILTPGTWNFYRAAMESSSYLRLNKVMQWFTGNIGFHHVHHLNIRIPFYRLPEAMQAIPELQSPETTTLAPRDILSCFRCFLWDEGLQRMVSYREARQLAAAA
ncbi:MAG: fatty acid desaturase [Gammaproteobacteria bacterium]|nr:fatty acid desaturase [Gammaproteobacteria bacterium]